MFFKFLNQQSQISITASQPNQACISLAQDNIWTEQPPDEQQVKTAAVTAWQGITTEENQCLVVSLGSRLQAGSASKRFSTKS